MNEMSTTTTGMFHSIAGLPKILAHRSQNASTASVGIIGIGATMNDATTPDLPQAIAWDTQSPTVSEGSLVSSTSSEQLALIGFAHRLYSVATNDEQSVGDKDDVRKEAQLLMSLSCLPPANITIQSGRTSPDSETSMGHSTGSKDRDSFCFSCPSLSLENRFNDNEGNHTAQSTSSSSCSSAGTDHTPAVLLGRVLKVDDRDALRLSSEAMARNIMQSYDKAIRWRIQSWIDSLSRILVDKEKQLVADGLDSEENLRKLRESSEALLIVYLRKIGSKIHVKDACTDFKVLSQRAKSQKTDGTEPPAKRQRTEASTDRASVGLVETDYEYSVTHLLTLQCDLQLEAPEVGNISIDLQVPGTMKGVFLSLADEYEQLTDVLIDVNTDILASMIEKSSRMVVRASVEAFLKQSSEGAKEDTAGQSNDAKVVADKEEPAHEDTAHVAGMQTPPMSSTPKPQPSEDRVANLAVVTPRDTSSPSSFEDSDNEHKPVALAIPDNFSDGEQKPLVVPQPKRSRGMDVVSTFTSSLLQRKTTDAGLPSVVTPSKTAHGFAVGDSEGPKLPVLVELALQLQK